MIKSLDNQLYYTCMKLAEKGDLNAILLEIKDIGQEGIAWVGFCLKPKSQGWEPETYKEYHETHRKCSVTFENFLGLSHFYYK